MHLSHMQKVKCRCLLSHCLHKLVARANAQHSPEDHAVEVVQWSQTQLSANQQPQSEAP